MATLAEQFVTSSDGTRLSYRALGGGPTLVMVHGALASSDLYLDPASRLADRWRVVLLDRRAYRRSGRGPVRRLALYEPPIEMLGAQWRPEHRCVEAGHRPRRVTDEEGGTSRC